ncbi:hypothetical protein KGF57_002992 [Candida theae]|uniref:Derlin n=1 Tax=Candida theae TaxID=1198502 RepID=A0AAD5FY43_9ASCO|nr:uncharacterized protein KGF57_002992 [Candida theae]KAI5957726.1 hypothetical protein KGF57_002992 [Candida theae]
MDFLWTNLPPVTKGWCVASMTISTLVTMDKLKSVNLWFIPGKIYNQNQTWRLITSFVTFGDLSMGFVFQLWIISSSCRAIESLYQTKFTQFPLYIVDDLSREQLGILRQLIERNRSIDFLYFIMQICVSIIVCATILFYKMGILLPQLGLVLISVFQYYNSKLTPLEMVNFFGFQFRNMYHPYFVALVNLLVSSAGAGQNSEPNQNRSGNFGRIALWSIESVLRNPQIWFYFISFGLGHLWWCTREVILGSMHYNDAGDATSLDVDERSRRIKRRQLLKQNGVWKFDLVKEALVILMLPPWYWIMLSKIKQQRPLGNRRQRPMPIELEDALQEDLGERVEEDGENADDLVDEHQEGNVMQNLPQVD